jgi:hypothetical protein
MKSIRVIWVLFLFVACTEAPVKRYRDLLEPRVGSARKAEINQLMGSPTYCKQGEAYELCEYRSSLGHNYPVSDQYRRVDSMGPDLSPYDQFDVLHLYFDNFGILKEWEPIVIKH